MTITKKIINQNAPTGGKPDLIEKYLKHKTTHTKNVRNHSSLALLLVAPLFKYYNAQVSDNTLRSL